MTGVTFQVTDLRGATLDGIDLKSLNLKGAQIDLGQAVQLAKSQGAIVE